MCSEIDKFSSFLRRNMSDGNSPRFFPVEKEEDKEEIIEPVNPPQPVSENTDSSQEIQPESKTTSSPQAEEKVEDITNEEDETDKVTVSSRESREKQIIAEDDDGFKTPTSSDHKIPAITQCPPAPKKARPPPSILKRKAASPPQICRSVEMDAPTEVESIFRPMSSKDNAEDDQQKIKKARKEEDDRS